MKNAIFILSILLFSNTLAFDLGGFSTNSYNYYSPNYGWNNSILGNNKLLNNLRMLGYNSITMPPLNFYSNHYPYPSQYHPFYNNYNNLRKPPRHAHRHPRPYPNRSFNRFNNLGHLTGFSPSKKAFQTAAQGDITSLQTEQYLAGKRSQARPT